MLTMIGIINAKAGPSACASLRWQWFATTRARVNSDRLFHLILAAAQGHYVVDSSANPGFRSLVDSFLTQQ